ncbi:MAG: hypothetical protein V3W18_10270 [candidate division Zixibacteria bacterium]
MYKIICLMIVSGLMMALLLPSPAKAEEIIISEIQTTVIESSELFEQCALILNFEIPSELDSAMITFAELAATMSFELPEGMPMTLGSVPISTSQEMDWQSFDYVKENLGNLFDLTKLSTASLGETSGVTAFFDITDTFQSWAQEPAAFDGLLIIPLDSSSIFSGLNEQDQMLEIRISYSTLDVEQ